jgi:hypothetical protein
MKFMSKIRILLSLLLILLSSVPTLARGQVDTRREDQLLKTALDYIERNRKGIAEIQFIDEITGKPVSGTGVQYQQASHDFMFSTHFWADPDRMRWLGLEWSGDLWLSWSEIQPTSGVYDFSKPDNRIRYMREYKEVRLWGRFTGFFLDWNYPMSPRPPGFADFDRINDPVVFARYKDLVYEFVFKVATHYKGIISAYVTQIELNWPGHAVFASHLSQRYAWTVQQAAEVNKVVSEAIRNADASAIIMLGTSTPFGGWSEKDMDPLEFTKLCLDSGVDVDMVALEAYPSDGTPAFYYDYVKRLATLGKPVFINETGYPSVRPSGLSSSDESWLRTWKWQVFNEHFQSLWFRYVFTFAFGMEECKGASLLYIRDGEAIATYARFSDPMGLFTTTWQPKESAAMLRELIANFTSSGTARTDGNGDLILRGFAGNYTVNVEGYQPFAVHVAEGVITNLTVTLIPKKTQFSTASTTSTNLSTTAISQQTPSFEGPPGLHLIPLAVVFMALVVATVLWSRRKKRTSKR